MAKPKNTLQSDAASAEQQNLDYAAPGRTTGVIAMLSLIGFTAVFMSLQGAKQREAETLRATQAQSVALALPQFVKIPAGEFSMGSDPLQDRMAYENERWSSRQRQGRVALPDYFIARHEVTNAQFATFLAATNQALLAQFNQRLAQLGSAQADSLPVTGITLPQMLAYARWLDSQLRESSLKGELGAQLDEDLRKLLAQGAKVTLPNEAEWEKAARGADGRIFPWGNEPSESYANFGSSSLVAVGSVVCDTCSYGLSDMAGNAWELTRSTLQDYPFELARPAESVLAQEPLWVMRGGSYADGINNVRSAVRGAVDPSVRNASIGFRVVVSTL